MSDERPKTTRKRTGDHMLPDGSLVITIKGTNTPYAKIEPAWADGQPMLLIKRIMMNDEEQTVLTLGYGGITSLIRWLPVILMNARRKGRRPTGKQQG